jgi:hypothetical protein
MLLLIRSVVLICLLAGLGMLFVVGMLIAPAVDERVGFFTARAMEAVQSYEVDGVPLRRVVDHQFQTVRWRAYHQDIPFQTFVECIGTPRSGGQERRMLWYVDERPTWNRGPSLRITIMTVLNRDALQLTPHLFDPRAGYLLQYWRHGVELP